MASLKRLSVVRQTSFADCHCVIQGTSVHKVRRSLLEFAATHVVFQMHVTMSKGREWVVPCTLRDVAHLHHQLMSTVDDAAFQAALAAVPCPKQPLFRRTNAFVIKGMCCNLAHYMHNVLQLCQQLATTSTDTATAVAVEGLMRAFLNPIKQGGGGAPAK
ncbi:Aste57867_3824 [Aphanomyces stellatus]|uniref:Aste57867_3824 protein n=1 Tax=Aphanomyces stellatus TaxID=120398 RepID=A0A485KC30_9STRA|nr:hypothetical protein As57867_003813 [Aphanomyces stellatus]VFT80972.1 Aste57867_3824 [Aphanomyces stellatus]